MTTHDLVHVDATPDTDRTLVDQIRRSDPAALEALMRAHANAVYRLVLGITRNGADAEEVVQDVFVTVFRKIDLFEARSALRTWIHRIAVNLALNKRRGKRREVEVPLDDHLPTFLPDGHRAGERAYLVADWSRTPEEELLAGEGQDVLRRALDELPDGYRAVLVLRDVEELTNEEVAQILGESVAAVKSRLHRARMVLRERMTRAVTAGAGRALQAR